MKREARISPEGKFIVNPRYEAGGDKRQLDGGRFLPGVNHIHKHINLGEVDYGD